jgi:hypothetical protein
VAPEPDSGGVRIITGHDPIFGKNSFLKAQ